MKFIQLKKKNKKKLFLFIIHLIKKYLSYSFFYFFYKDIDLDFLLEFKIWKILELKHKKDQKNKIMIDELTLR
jgi:hypothetical protein